MGGSTSVWGNPRGAFGFKAGKIPRDETTSQTHSLPKTARDKKDNNGSSNDGPEPELGDEVIRGPGFCRGTGGSPKRKKAYGEPKDYRDGSGADLGDYVTRGPSFPSFSSKPKHAYIDFDENAIVMELNPEMSIRKVKSTIHRAAKLRQKFEKKLEKDAGFADYVEHRFNPKVMVKGLYQENEQNSFENILKDELSHAERKRDKRDSIWIEHDRVSHKNQCFPFNYTTADKVAVGVLVGIVTLGTIPAYCATKVHLYNKADQNCAAIGYIDRNKTYVPAKSLSVK